MGDIVQAGWADHSFSLICAYPVRSIAISCKGIDGEPGVAASSFAFNVAMAASVDRLEQTTLWMRRMSKFFDRTSLSTRSGASTVIVIIRQEFVRSWCPRRSNIVCLRKIALHSA